MVFSIDLTFAVPGFPTCSPYDKVKYYRDIFIGAFHHLLVYSDIQANRDALARVFPRLPNAARIFLEF